MLPQQSAIDILKGNQKQCKVVEENGLKRVKDHTVPVIAAKVCEVYSWERERWARRRSRSQGEDIRLQNFVLGCLLIVSQPKTLLRLICYGHSTRTGIAGGDGQASHTEGTCWRWLLPWSLYGFDRIDTASGHEKYCACLLFITQGFKISWAAMDLAVGACWSCPPDAMSLSWSDFYLYSNYKLTVSTKGKVFVFHCAHLQWFCGHSSAL